MIILTENAIRKIKEISDEEEIGHYNIRAKVLGGGCAGMTQDLYFEEVISENDEIFEFEGVKLIVDPLSFQYLDNCSIDYYQDTFSGGFKFLNPNVVNSCGCGKSVAF